MTTLKNLFLDYNLKVYNKRNGIPKKAEKTFHKVEMMLTKADIGLDDYTLTTFVDRSWIAQKLGYLPWTVFISDKSLMRYIKRLEAGAEVTVNATKEPIKLLVELVVGEVIIGLMLQDIEPDDEIIEYLASVPPGYMGDCRRPIEEAAELLSRKYQTPLGYYTDIANSIRRNRDQLESKLQATGNSSNHRKFLVA